MLSQADKAIIKYCSEQGMSYQNIATAMNKSRQWMYQIAAQDYSQIFPCEEASLWFYAGIRAANMLHSTESLTSQPPCKKKARNKDYYRQKAQKRDVSIQNLRKARGSEYCEQQEPEYKEEDDEFCTTEEEDRCSSQSGVEGPSHILARSIIADIEQNMMREEPRTRRYCRSTVMFSYILRSYSSACYEYLRKVFPLPSRQLIMKQYRAIEERLESSYQTLDLGYIIPAYFDRHPLKSMDETLVCSISVDAFSMSVLEKKHLVTDAIKILTQDLKTPTENTKVELDISNPSEEVTPEEELTSRLLATVYNNVFLIVLNPLNWEHPSAVLAAFSWTSGHANHEIIKLLAKCIEELKEYNIEVRAIGSDGDSGYNSLHDSFFGLWEDLRNDELIDICDRISERPHYDLKLLDTTVTLSACPVADPLHAIKIARSRVLRQTVYLTKDVTVSHASFVNFENERWFSDTSQLSKLSDFYALSMFSVESFIQCCRDGERAAAIYLWPWLSLMLVIRVPFLSLECRKSLLSGAFTMFQFFFNQKTSKDVEDVKVADRAFKGYDGVTLFEKKYLLRVIHLIICIYRELCEGPRKLRMSSFGSHINENIIGRIRVTCHGDPRFTVIMRSIAKAELRRIHQAELGVEHCIRGRDNVGGTKLNPDITEVMEGIDFTAAAKGLLKALDFNAGDVAQVELDKIVEFLVGVEDRKDQIYRIYQPNHSSTSGILARLMHFESNVFSQT